MITGPQQMAALGEAPFRVEDANFRALDGRMWSSLNAPRTPSKLEAWVAYDYGSIDMQAGAQQRQRPQQHRRGRRRHEALRPRCSPGCMFGYTENKGDFGGDGGGFKLRQPVCTLYAGYGEGPWYVGATLGAGSLDYSDVNRNIDLGAAVRNESGQTRGYEYTARLLGGYWFKYQDMLHGPYARADVHEGDRPPVLGNGAGQHGAHVRPAGQRRRCCGASGWQVAGKFGGIRPFARVTWEYDSQDNDRDGHRVVEHAGRQLHRSRVAKPDNSYALFNLGAATDFGGVTGYISGSGTAARGDGNYWAITVGLRMPL